LAQDSNLATCWSGLEKAAMAGFLPGVFHFSDNKKPAKERVFGKAFKQSLMQPSL
jgi:hypothetical protein